MNNRLVHSIADACEAACTGRTALYEAINSEELRAVKRGSRTLILDEDLRRWLHSLPPIKVKRSGTLSSKTDLKDGDDGAGEKSSTRRGRRGA